MSTSKGQRRERRGIDIALLVAVILTVASAFSPLVENLVGVVVAIASGLLFARMAWEIWGVEWRRDRDLIREIGPIDGPPPILMIAADGRETIIPSTSSAYPAALAERVRENELARRRLRG